MYKIFYRVFEIDSAKAVNRDNFTDVDYPSQFMQHIDDRVDDVRKAGVQLKYEPHTAYRNGDASNPSTFGLLLRMHFRRPNTTKITFEVHRLQREIV